MNKVNEPFKVKITIPGGGNVLLQVRHDSETFDLRYDGQIISMLNNGDNSWSLVSGELDQEQVNLIGTAIEQYYQQLDP